MSLDGSGGEMSAFESTVQIRTLGMGLVEVATLGRRVTTSVSNRGHDFMWSWTMVETRYSVEIGPTRPARESRIPTLACCRSRRVGLTTSSQARYTSRDRAALAAQACRRPRQINFSSRSPTAPGIPFEKAVHVGRDEWAANRAGSLAESHRVSRLASRRRSPERLGADESDRTQFRDRVPAKADI
jgi:hypothetical protein